MGLGWQYPLKAELKSSISIIIPAFNVEASIGTTLGSLGEWADRAEVLVVDDGSTDCTGEIIKRAGVRVDWARVAIVVEGHRSRWSLFWTARAAWSI